MIRVDPKNPCPICKHGKYCAFSEDGNYVACKRVPEGAITNLGQFGYLHKIEHIDLTGYHKVERPHQNWKQLQQDYRIKLSTSGNYPVLGCKIDTYNEYFIGWNGQGWTFPMFDANLNVTGIQTRYPDHTKCCVTGSTAGVFLPKHLWSCVRKTLGICEGVSDAMTAFDMGLLSIGKFNCNAPHEIITQLVTEKIKPSKVVIFSDRNEDGAGQNGTKELIRMLKLYSAGLHIKGVLPPEGIKDLRGWREQGLTQKEFDKLIGKKI